MWSNLLAARGVEGAGAAGLFGLYMFVFLLDELLVFLAPSPAPASWSCSCGSWYGPLLARRETGRSAVQPRTAGRGSGATTSAMARRATATRRRDGLGGRGHRWRSWSRARRCSAASRRTTWRLMSGCMGVLLAVVVVACHRKGIPDNGPKRRKRWRGHRFGQVPGRSERPRVSQGGVHEGSCGKAAARRVHPHELTSSGSGRR